jgi:general nucleoside transport system permease protein
VSVNHSTAVQFIVITIAAGTPLIWAALGEILAERSGVMNLGIEGMMLVGAVTAYGVEHAVRNLWIGLLAGALAAAALAALHAFLSISLKASQIVSGIALVILGSGISSFVGSTGQHPLSGKPSAGSFQPVITGGPAHWPVVGPIIFGQDVLVYLSWAAVAAVSFYLFHTRFGLRLRAVGENPASADASGIPVARVRYAHTIAGGAFAGIAGAYLSLALFNSWQDNLSAGQGWIAVAIVIFSRWRPWRAFVAAYLFGALTSLGFNLQLLKIHVPLDFLAALPFIMTLIALVAVSNLKSARRLGAPAALATPYWRESR